MYTFDWNFCWIYIMIKVDDHHIGHPQPQPDPSINMNIIKMFNFMNESISIKEVYTWHDRIAYAYMSNICLCYSYTVPFRVSLWTDCLQSKCTLPLALAEACLGIAHLPTRVDKICFQRESSTKTCQIGGRSCKTTSSARLSNPNASRSTPNGIDGA